MKELCKQRMAKQSKLELYWDYNDYLEPDQVGKFLDYCEEQISKWNYQEPESYLYNWFTFDWWMDRFNSYEQEQFWDYYVVPFIKEHPEYEDKEDEVNEILWELMYDMNMYDSNLKHFNKKEYNFYLLTDPELTYELYDWSHPFIETKHKYLRSLQRSQHWTNNSKSMRELLRSGWYNWLWICINLNMWLFEFIDLMKAKRLTVLKWTKIYMFNPYIWTWWDTTELTSDWSFNLELSEIGFWIDNNKKWPWWYTPDVVYGRVHSYFNCNKVYFTSLRK